MISNMYQHAQANKSEQTALERQDLPCTYLAHHELESVNIITIIIKPTNGLT